MRGDVVVASLGYTNPIVAAGREAAPSYKLVAETSRGAMNVVCNKDVTVSGWNDLKGKKFGILAGGPAELFFDDAVTTHGVSRKDIPATIFTAPGPPLLQALHNRDIDCTAVFEPIAASVVQKGIAVYAPVNLAENTFRGINGVIGANVAFLKDNTPFASDLASVIVKATSYYNAHKEALQTDFKRLEFSPEVINVGVDHVILDANLYFASALKEAQAMARLGFIKSAPPAEKLAAYYHYSFMTKATGKSEDAAGRAE